MTTQGEILQATKERLEAGKTEKSEQWIAERKAKAAAAWYEFIVSHVRERDSRGGIAHPYYQCLANTKILEEFCAEQIPPGVSRLNLELGYESLTASNRLAKAPFAEYKQQTQARQPFTPHRPEMTPPPVHLNYSRAEILSWTANQLRRQMAVPGYEAEINRILREDRY
jgi:hypothetical protein